MDVRESISAHPKNDDFAETPQKSIGSTQKLQAGDSAGSLRSNGGGFLSLGDQSLRKSASFNDITKVPDEAPARNLGRRGSLPQSLPSSPHGGRAVEKPPKPWKLRRSSTPVPGSLDVSSILKKARKSFSSGVGTAPVEENED